MKTILSIGILVLAIQSLTYGQEQTVPVKKVRISEFSLNSGSSTAPGIYMSVTDFRKLAPQSTLLDRDFTGFKTYSAMENKYQVFSALVGLQFRDKEKKGYNRNPLLRVGISYFSGIELEKSLTKDTKTPIDTFYSTQNDLAYVDSVYHNGYDLRYTNNQIRLEGSLIFRTNQQLRWSWYAGIGITAGFSINANTIIWNSVSTYRETTYNNGDVYTSSSYKDNKNDSREEEFSNKNVVAFSGFLPLGVDFRIARKNELLKHVHLFLELRPGINSMVIPDLRTITTSTMQGGLGLKISLY